MLILVRSGLGVSTESVNGQSNDQGSMKKVSEADSDKFSEQKPLYGKGYYEVWKEEDIDELRKLKL